MSGIELAYLHTLPGSIFTKVHEANIIMPILITDGTDRQFKHPLKVTKLATRGAKIEIQVVVFIYSP